MPNEFHKRLQIDVTVDEKSKENLKKIEKIEKMNKLKAIGAKVGQVGAKIPTAIGNYVVNGITEAIKSAAMSMSISFGDIISDAVSEIDRMYQSTTLSNAQSRQLAFEYGFNAQQRYAFSKTMEYMGLSSLEDVIHLEPGERERYNERFAKYQEKYTELYDSGFFKDLRDMQYAYKDFQEEITYTGMKFIVDNKQVLSALFQTTVKILQIGEKLLSFLVWSGPAFTERTPEQRQASISDILSRYTTAGTDGTKNYNVNVNNSFSNVSEKDKPALVALGQMNAEQIVRALGGE